MAFIQPPKKDKKQSDDQFEFKTTILGFAVSKNDCETKKSFIKLINKHRAELCLKQEYDSDHDDIFDCDKNWYVATGKSYDNLIS